MKILYCYIVQSSEFYQLDVTIQCDIFMYCTEGEEEEEEAVGE